MMKAFGLTGEKHEQFEEMPREEPCHRTFIVSRCTVMGYDVAVDEVSAFRAQMWEPPSQNRTIPKM